MDVKRRFAAILGNAPEDIQLFRYVTAAEKRAMQEEKDREEKREEAAPVYGAPKTDVRMCNSAISHRGFCLCSYTRMQVFCGRSHLHTKKMYHFVN